MTDRQKWVYVAETCPKCGGTGHEQRQVTELAKELPECRQCGGEKVIDPHWEQLRGGVEFLSQVTA
jgi:hypothetical protein